MIRAGPDVVGRRGRPAEHKRKRTAGGPMSSTDVTPKRTINGIDELRRLVGQELGVSDWHEVTQEQIDKFAEVTGDHQWIHVDVERARRESPFGTTIAHGYLILSLVAPFSYEMFGVEGVNLVVNYGLNRVRFISPLPAGSRLRMRSRLDEVVEVSGGHQSTSTLTMEREDGDKPVCVAEQLTRYY
jgi:acyl dehydratase